MAANPLEYFIRFSYQSAYGLHTMDRPTREWVGTNWESAGSYTAWDETPIAADVMAEAFVDLLLPMFKPSTSFIGYEIFALRPDWDTPYVVWAENFVGKVGTSDDDTQDRAWQRTYTMRTTGSWLTKLVLLDTPCGGLASRYATLPALSPDLPLIAYLLDPAHAWSGRADERPAFFLSLVTDTNEALRKKYGVG